MCIRDRDYKAENLLSLSGVYQPTKENKDSKIPIALSVFLEKNPLIKTIHLHLDNDKTGRLLSLIHIFPQDGKSWYGCITTNSTVSAPVSMMGAISLSVV